MVIEIDKTATVTTVKTSLRRLHAHRVRRKQPLMAQFFGALPNIGDGLKLQKQARNEWD